MKTLRLARLLAAAATALAVLTLAGCATAPAKKGCSSCCCPQTACAPKKP